MELNSHPLIIFREKRFYRRVQRCGDVTIGLFALILLLPVIALAIMAILLEDGRPIFFVQKRVGRFEKLFTIYKLRTMRGSHCGDALSPGQSHDLRLTRVGRLLRKASIDEIPQFFNVLRGEMALVGPRPEMPFLVKLYQPWQHARHLVRPGMTCTWQTTCRSTVPLQHPAATMLDLEYIQRASLFLDGVLLAKTVRAVLTGTGAY